MISAKIFRSRSPEFAHYCSETEGREIDVRAEVRTGDTTAAQRQALIKKPPHILVTTPESLYLLLTSESGRRMLSTVRTLIVDEIHAVVDDRRGAHLALSIERLAALTQRPLQRIGLSATQKPIEEVARFLVGHARAVDRSARQSRIARSSISVTVANWIWRSKFPSRRLRRSCRTKFGRKSIIVSRS